MRRLNMNNEDLNDVIIKCLKSTKRLSKGFPQITNNDFIEEIPFNVGVFRPLHSIIMSPRFLHLF